MRPFQFSKNSADSPRRTPAIVTACVLLISGAITTFAQAPMAPMSPGASTTGDQNKQLMDQIAELRAQVTKLQAAQMSPGRKPMAKSGMSMGSKPMAMPMMDDKGEMGGMAGKPPMGPMAGGGMKDDQGEMGEMGTMPSAPAAPAAAMGMCCMGKMGGMSGGAAPPAGGMAGMNSPSSAMPAQPGASHLYHIGSTGFFLNHPQHITLTQDQRMTLNRLKEKAMLERASTERRIDQHEQELYALTGADQPDTSRIQAKIAEIEKLRGDERMNFIKAVGEASSVLTNDQRMALMGTMAGNRK